MLFLAAVVFLVGKHHLNTEVVALRTDAMGARYRIQLKESMDLLVL